MGGIQLGKKCRENLLRSLWNSALGWIYLSFSPLPFASLLFTAIRKASSDLLLRPQFCLCAFLGDGLDPCLLYNVTNLHP